MAQDKGNPKRYWMKRKRYGFGWIPGSWQGWLMLALLLAVVILDAQTLPAKPVKPSSAQLFRFFAILAAAVLVLVLISIRKGPAPRWRWGKKDSDDPDEDF